MVQQVDNPVAAVWALEGRERALSGAGSWGSLGLLLGTCLPATPARDWMVD
jgi:hypothetical protein